MTINPARQPAGVPVGGQFATMTKSEAAGVTLAHSPADPDVAGFEAARETIREAWMDAEDTPEFPQVDRQMQRASAQLAAAAVLRDYPGAETLVLWENADGENQYDVIAVRDANELDIVDSFEDSDWTRNEVGGTNSVQLDELGWALDLQDDGWAEGIAEVSNDRFNGKTAVINLKAAVEAPPVSLTPRQVTNAALKRYTDLAAFRARSGRNTKGFKEASQQASVQLLAASLLEKYPTAAKLNVQDSYDRPEGYEVLSLVDADNRVLEQGKYGNGNFFEQYVPGGGPKLNDLLLDLDKKDTSWADGIGETKTNVHPGHTKHFATIDLQAAMAKRGPAANEEPMRLAS